MTFLEARSQASNPQPTVGVNQMPGLPGVTGTNPYGYIPQVPDLLGSQSAVTAGNLANWPGIAELLKQFSQGTTAAAQEPYNSALPGWQGGMQTGFGNAMDFMQGKIPQSDLSNLINNTLSNRFARGINAGSPASNAAIVQQILGGELGLQKQGLQDFSTLMGMVPKGAQLDPSSLLVNPEQYQNWAWLSSLMRAAPDPTLARQAELGAMGAGLGTYNRSPASLADQLAANYFRSRNMGSPFMPGGGGTQATGRTTDGTGFQPDMGIEWYGTAPDATLAWSGQDWGDLFGSPTEDYGWLDPTYGWDENQPLDDSQWDLGPETGSEADFGWWEE